MYWFARGFGVLTVLVLLLPSWAQDEPKKPGKDDKKEAKKPAKKSIFADKDPKDKDKKSPAKKEDAEKVSFGATFTGKMKSIDPNSQKDFTVELQLPDSQKIYDFELWKTQQQISLNQQRISIAQAGDVNTKQQRIISYQSSLAQFNLGMAQRQNNLTSPKDVELRATNDIKIRSSFPPTEYDDKGKLKRWNLKELKALKKGSKLPGYPAEYDFLKPGQVVAVYLAKPPPTPKKKGLKIEDPVEAAVGKRPEVVMIVVVQDPLPQR